MALGVSYMIYTKNDDEPDTDFSVSMNQEWIVLDGSTTLSAAFIGISALIYAAF